MEIKRKDILICGFALFAIFFGAGNIIFPPYLGVVAGDRWFTAAIGFLLSDPVLPIVGVIVTARLGGRAIDLGKRVGWKFSAVVAAISILIIGPFFAVPRTGATTHELFIMPNLPSVPSFVTSIVFFGLTLYLVLNPGKVLDYIGRFLTPALLIILAIIVVVAIANPPAAPVATDATNLFRDSFKEGYQTMDALGASLMSGIVLTDLIRRGYHDRDTQVKASIMSGVIAFICLALVYGSMTYVGSTVSSMFTPDMDRTEILLGTVNAILGGPGQFALGLAVALACLTTSVGLTSTCGNFFNDVTNGKLSYRQVVVTATIIAFALSLIGVEGIINIAVPVLTAVFPIVICLILFSIFDEKIKYNAVFTGGVIGAGVISLIEAINLFSQMQNGNLLGGIAEKIYALPLGNIAFEWLIPSLICAVIGGLLGKFANIGGTREDVYREQAIREKEREKEREKALQENA
ncbi:MAG: branched-chain amino acid transport system II carrier protein [Peptoniphilus sp.]|nr:branched-chain amino acid transport system II carrier protein [Peptoniphilus sp.]MDD7363459.1 branched-chain amino acid transport system II carrier protein [Bacillota bacterium]MDY6044837.1 branched-chain amino acid transport system II carrier protein [Peptoniphilus sp.]